MNKKERVLAAIQKKPVDYVPCSFSLHFPKDVNSGEAGVNSHIKFLKDSDVDILKVMNENQVPCYAEFKDLRDYDKIPKITIKSDFMQQQMDFTKAILDKIDEPVFSVGTLHGPCASGIHPLRNITMDYPQRITMQMNALRTYPKKTFDAMRRITDGMCELAEAYVKAGLDGVYMAALGGEYNYYTEEEFEKWIKPLDLQVLDAIRGAGGYAILHICKEGIDMNRYRDYVDHADIFNWGVYEVPYSLEDGRKLFNNKTIMGGLQNRQGVLVDGSDDDIKKAVHDVINDYGTTGFILGADCTLATEQDMHRLRVAVEARKDIKG